MQLCSTEIKTSEAVTILKDLEMIIGQSERLFKAASNLCVYRPSLSLLLFANTLDIASVSMCDGQQVLVQNQSHETY